MKYAVERSCDRKTFDEPFSFEVSSIEVKLKRTERSGTGVDISSCGLGMKTKQAVNEGSVVKFYFPLREWDITVPVYAQVMWASPANDHFRVGLRFLD